MLRIASHTVYGGLAQWEAPNQNDIERVTRSVPACFKSREILSLIDGSIAFAEREVGTSRWSQGPTKLMQSLQGQMSTARNVLVYWRDRLSTELEKTYCMGKTDDMDSSDKDQIVAALVQPYAISSQIAGSVQTQSQASQQLSKELFVDPATAATSAYHTVVDPLAKTWSWLPYIVVGGVGLAVVVAIGRVMPAKKVESDVA